MHFNNCPILTRKKCHCSTPDTGMRMDCKLNMHPKDSLYMADNHELCFKKAKDVKTA